MTYLGGKRGKRSFNNFIENNQQTNKWRKKIEKQGRIISALKAEIKSDSSKDRDDNQDDDKKNNKRVKYNAGVTQRTHSNQE